MAKRTEAVDLKCSCWTLLRHQWKFIFVLCDRHSAKGLTYILNTFYFLSTPFCLK